VVGEDTHLSGLGGDVDLDTRSKDSSVTARHGDNDGRLCAAASEGEGDIHAGRSEDGLYVAEEVSLGVCRDIKRIYGAEVVPGEGGPGRA
jgi:hypothetical protein